MFTSLIIALVWCKQLFCYTHIHRYYTFGLKDQQVGFMLKYFTGIHMCKRLKSLKLPQKTWIGVNSLPASAIIPAKNTAPQGLLNLKVYRYVVLFRNKSIELIALQFHWYARDLAGRNPAGSKVAITLIWNGLDWAFLWIFNAHLWQGFSYAQRYNTVSSDCNF